MSRILNAFLAILLLCSYWDRWERQRTPDPTPVTWSDINEPAKTSIAKRARNTASASQDDRVVTPAGIKSRAPASLSGIATAIQSQIAEGMPKVEEKVSEEEINEIIDLCWKRDPTCIARSIRAKDPRTNRAALSYSSRICEDTGHCSTAAFFAEKTEMFDLAAQYAKVGCERTKKPCYAAGRFSRLAGYDDETIFWSVVEKCEGAVGGKSCEQLQAQGYNQKTWLQLLSTVVETYEMKTGAKHEFTAADFIYGTGEDEDGYD